MTSSLRALPKPDAAAARELRRRTVFECCKWDPQIGDVPSLSMTALGVTAAEWTLLANLAERLYKETLAAEHALARVPGAARALGFRGALGSALDSAVTCGVPQGPRVMRFDFHPTREGWRVSEVNSDVPGGYIEASGFTSLMAQLHTGWKPAGDPCAVLLECLHGVAQGEAPIALVHATAYTDDRQVMVYLAKRLQSLGMTGVLTGPDGIQWEGRSPRLSDGRLVSAIMRFFPAEWLANLSGRNWRRFFEPTSVPQFNPATALFTQSKAFPLMWADAGVAMDTWSSVAPLTVRWTKGLGSEWVRKPVLGRVGDGIGILGVTNEADWTRIERAAARHPHEWVVQHRFESMPLDTADGPRHACIGVYVIGGRVAGAYGRLAPTALINQFSQDAAVLVMDGPETGHSSQQSTAPR